MVAFHHSRVARRLHLTLQIDRCRKRKVRCNFDDPGQKCMLCREKGWECVSSRVPYKRADSDSRPLKRTRLGSETPIAEQSASSRPSITITRQTEPRSTSVGASPAAGLQASTHGRITSPAESSTIVGPVIAEDIEALEQYLTTKNHPQDNFTNSSDRPHAFSKASGNHILYLSVPRRRDGLKLAKDPGASQKEIIEQIIGPFRDNLMNLYGNIS